MSASPTIAVELDDEETVVQLPGHWAICPTCRGNGGHSLHLGAITQEDRRLNWDEEAFQDYMDGAYDRTCETCDGSGKVVEIDREACASRPEWAAALAQKDSNDEIDRQLAAEERAEFHYCYGY